MATKIIIAILLFTYLVSCRIEPSLSGISIPNNNLLYVVGTDFSSIGFLSAISIDDFSVFREIAPTHSDSLIKIQDLSLFILNRLGVDNLVRFNLDELTTPAYEVSLGSRSNPYDMIKVNSQELWVTLYGRDYISIRNSDTGSEINQISLSRWADEDSFPEASNILLHENYAYVTVQRLLRNQTNWPVSGISYLLKIDIRDTSKIQKFVLPYTNPMSMRYVSSRDHLWIACPGNYAINYELDGGICVFDIEAEVFLSSPLTEVDINIDIVDTILLSNSSALVLGLEQNLNSLVAVYDLLTKERIKVLASLDSQEGGFFSDITTHNNRIYIADRNPHSPGVRIFNLQTLKEITEQPIDVGLPPFSLEVFSQ